MGSGSLLSREGDECFAFFHQSVMEWLVVRRAAKAWNPAARDTLFAEGKLSELMAQFLVEMLGEGAATEALRSIGTSDNTRVRENAARVQGKLRADRVDLHGQDLRELDLEPLLDRLQGANLSGVFAEGLQLRFVSLRRANLRGAHLAGADLTGADLTDADLTDADLTAAKLTGARLGRAKLRGATVDRASFLYAEVEMAQVPPGRFFDPTPRSAERVEGRFLAPPFGAEELGCDTFCVAFHPGGYLVAFGRGTSILLADARTGAICQILRSHLGTVTGIAFSLDGSRLATGSYDGTARVWDSRTGQTLATLQGHTSVVTSVAFSSDGTRLATGSANNTARVWDSRTGHTLATLQRHTDWVRSVAFSSDGTHLATGASDSTARVWDCRTGQTLATLQGHEGTVNAVAFSPDDRWLATASDDGTTRIWDLATSRWIVALLAVGDAWVAFAPDGRYRSAGDLRGNFWHAVGACRFEVGELDGWCDLRLPDGVPFDAPRGPLTAKPRPQPPARPKRSPPPAPIAAATPTRSMWPDALAGVCVSAATFATCSLVLDLHAGPAALGALAGGVCGALGARLVRRRAG